LNARATVAAVALSEEERRDLPGPAIAEQLRKKRLAALTALMGQTTAGDLA